VGEGGKCTRIIAVLELKFRCESSFKCRNDDESPGGGGGGGVGEVCCYGHQMRGYRPVGIWPDFLKFLLQGTPVFHLFLYVNAIYKVCYDWLTVNSSLYGIFRE
jgi:hypothetical protein